MKRDIALDIVRVICTLWIVCVWHLSSYSDSWDISQSIICQNLTRASLFCFMFLSGYLLKKYRFECLYDVGVFYKKRFLRFYPLFFVSALLLFLVSNAIGKPWFNSNSQFVLCVLGLSSFSMPQPPTLWFMSMLMFFYIITPLLNYNHKRGLLRVILLFFLFLTLFLRKGQFDIAIFQYGFAYFMGFLLPISVVARLRETPFLGFALLVFGIVLLLIDILFGDIINTLNSIKILFIIFLSSVFTFSLLSLSYFIVNKLSARTGGGILFHIVQFIAYSSFALYLFHRHIYQSLEFVCESLQIAPSIIILYLVFVPIAIFSSYCIQIIYDKLIKLLK